MSEKSSKKLVRNGQSMNNDDKKRSTEGKNSSKKNVEKKFQKEKEKQNQNQRKVRQNTTFFMNEINESF